MDSANKEILGMLIEEGKNNADEKVEEEKEKAEEAADKKEEQDKQIEEAPREAQKSGRDHRGTAECRSARTGCFHAETEHE